MIGNFFKNLLLQKLILKNPQNNDFTTVPLGYSWTLLASLLFSAWVVPFYRKNYILAIFAYIIPLIITIQMLKNPSSFIYIGAIWAFYIVVGVFAAFYNKIYLNSLFKKGYFIVYAPKNYKLEPTNFLEENSITMEEIHQTLAKKTTKRLVIMALVFLAAVFVSYILSFNANVIAVK
jgi:hypothetical protein